MTDAPLSVCTPEQITLQTRWRAVLWFWGFRVLAAAFLALPWAGAISASGIGEFPDGDARLFADGGTYLVEVLRISATPLGTVLRGSSIVVLGLGVIALFPLALLLVALNHRSPIRISQCTARAVQHFVPFLVLSSSVLLAQVLLALSASFALVPMHALREQFDPRWVDAARLGILGLVLWALLSLGALLDLGRAAVVRQCVGASAAFRSALETVRARPVGALLGWIPYTAVALLAVAAGAVGSSLLDVSKPGAIRLLLVFLWHQLVALVLVFARAAWLAQALRLVAEQEITAQVAASSPEH